MAARPSARARRALELATGTLVAAVALGLCAGSVTAAPRAGAEETVTISVRVQGPHGAVVSIPRGIACPDACRAPFRRGSEVTLIAGSRPDARLRSWSGGCVGSAAICVLVADRSTAIVARFVRSTSAIGGAIRTRYPVNVTLGGPGTVSSAPPGISCPARCDKTFPKGTRVTLTATSPGAGYAPVWSSLLARCRGRSCSVRVDGNVEVGASFRRTR